MEITAYKIDVQERKVYKVELTQSDLQTYYEHIGNGCSMLEVAAVMEAYTFWCDEEARINNSPIGGVVLRLPNSDYPITICGNVLITGTNFSTGESISATGITAQEIRQLIYKFLTEEESASLQF